jgi:hypothetical protein
MSERLTRAEVDSDYHDLKQVLRDAGKGVHIEIRKEWDNSLDRLHSMALALASLSEGWVSVEEQLPGELRMVLLVTPTSQRCAVDYGYRKGRDFFVQSSIGWDDTRNFGSEVTHWRDLPSPPVGKD